MFSVTLRETQIKATLSYYFTPIRMASEIQKVSRGEGVEHSKALFVCWVRMYIGIGLRERNKECPQNIKSGIIYLLALTILGIYLFKIN